MAVTTTTRSTLDIKFHIQDGTVTGDSYIWKLNYPLGGASSTLSLDDVKDAFDLDGTHAAAKNKFGTFCRTNNCNLVTKEGYIIDGIDSASIVITTTTKNELS